MRHLRTITLAAGALAATALGMAGTANAAPSGPSTVEQTIGQLKSDGYNVIVNRVGAAPLADCTINNVRPGQTITQQDTRGGSSIVTTVISKTVYVDVAC
jgi:hypothetical protein